MGQDTEKRKINKWFIPKTAQELLNGYTVGCGFSTCPQPDLILFNSLIHPLSGVCDISKQPSQTIFPLFSASISDILNRPEIFHSMERLLQFHLKSGLGNMDSGMTIIPLLWRTALFALTHPDMDNRGQLSRATDFIITSV